MATTTIPPLAAEEMQKVKSSMEKWRFDTSGLGIIRLGPPAILVGRYAGQPKIEFVRNHGKDSYDIFVMTQRGPMKLASLDRDGIPIVDVPQPKKSAYKEGYLRTEWLMEAHERCMNSEKVIRVQLERTGLVLVGTQADDYETRVIKWETLEKADHNIILDNIELLENQLDIVGKLKVVDGKRRKTA